MTRSPTLAEAKGAILVADDKADVREALCLLFKTARFAVDSGPSQ